MIIDSKGKLFGKISVIDILIVAIIVGGLAGVWFKFGRAKSITPIIGKSDTIIMEYYVEKAIDDAVKTVKVGETVRDFTRGITVGKILEVKPGPSVDYNFNDAGKSVASPREGYSSLRLTIEASGIYSNTGVSISNVNYYSGSSQQFTAGNSIFWGFVANMKKKE